MKEECAGRPRGMIADMKHESKVGLIDRDIGKMILTNFHFFELKC